MCAARLKQWYRFLPWAQTLPRKCDFWANTLVCWSYKTLDKNCLRKGSVCVEEGGFLPDSANSSALEAGRVRQGRQRPTNKKCQTKWKEMIVYSFLWTFICYWSKRTVFLATIGAVPWHTEAGGNAVPGCWFSSGLCYHVVGVLRNNNHLLKNDKARGGKFRQNSQITSVYKI